MADRHALQAEGKHPSPCAKFCEANAFYIEARQQRSHIEELEQEAKLMRARNERLEAEVAELRKDAALAEVDLFAKDATNGHLSALVDAEREDAERYRWLRSRDLDAIALGGVFAGKTPDNVILNGDDLDAAIDAAKKVTE